MPLGLKQLDTGHFLIFTVETIVEGNLHTRMTTRDSESAERIRRRLREHHHIHDNCCTGYTNAFVRREIVVSAGDQLHTLTGKRFKISEVANDFEWYKTFETLTNEDWILHRFGDRPKRLRPTWQRYLIVAFCLCCLVDQSAVRH